jgi:hypothetical protein
MIKSMCHQTQVEPDASAPFLCMKLMCSQNQDEVEVVKNELRKAGIAAETRYHPLAEALGVKGVELWVQHERDFFNASKLYARIQEGAAGKTAGTAGKPQRESPKRDVGATGPGAEQSKPAGGELKNVDARQKHEPRREELKQASSLLERGIEEMFLREGQLAGQCAALRTKVEELSKSLAQAQTDLSRELESRMVAETNQTEQISGLVNTLERERQEWQQQLKRRDDSLKNLQEKLDSMSRSLQTEQAAVVALKDQIVSLEQDRDEHQISLANARAEALAEREARIAADERAEKATRAKEAFEKQLGDQTKRDQQMQAYVAGLSSLFSETETKATRGLPK